MIRHRGFTLIELLMVVAIISLLSSVVFYKVSEAKKKGEDAHMKAESAEVAKAVYQYKDSSGGYVPGASSVTRGTTHIEGSDEYNTAMQELVSSGYLSEIPYSPSGDGYAYIISDEGFDAVFAADLNYSSSNSAATNSCTITQSEEEEESSCVPPPPYPPYYGGSGYNYHTMGPIPGTCSSGQLYFYASSNGYSCVDNNSSNASAYCNCSTSSALNPSNTPPEACGTLCAGGTSPKALLWSTNGYSGYYNYLQELEEYNQQVEDYESCLEDEEAANDGICNGSTDTDYCTCL